MSGHWAGPRKAASSSEDRLRESAVEQELVALTQARKAICKKVTDRRGWPDREVFWPGGELHIIETKRPKNGKFEPLQKRTMRKLLNLGHTVLLLYTKTQVREYVKYIDSGYSSREGLIDRFGLDAYEHLHPVKRPGTRSGVLLRQARRKDAGGDGADDERDLARRRLIEFAP